MLRKMLGGVFVLALVASAGWADEVTGKVKSTDAENMKLVVTVDDKDLTFTLTKETEVFSLGKAKKKMPAPKVAVSGGLGGLKTDDGVTITFEKKDDKVEVQSVKVDAQPKKKKKNQ